MKNTCKKLFSLMLAVVLLVSVVPFQASADTIDMTGKYINIIQTDGVNYVKVDLNADGTVNADQYNAIDWSKYEDVASWTMSDSNLADQGTLAQISGYHFQFNDYAWNVVGVKKEQKPDSIDMSGKYINVHVSSDKYYTVHLDAEGYVYESEYNAIPWGSYTNIQSWTMGDSNGASKGTLSAINGYKFQFEDHAWDIFAVLKEESTKPDPTKYQVKITVDGTVVKTIPVEAGGTVKVTETDLGVDLSKRGINETEKLGEYKDINHSFELNFTTYKKTQVNVPEKGSENNRVILNIFQDGTFKNPKVVYIDGREEIAYDNYVSKEEVESVIMKYYKAKDSYGIDVDGIYVHTGNVIDKWQKNNKHSEIDENTMIGLRNEGNVYLSVWIDNAVAKKASTADSSNPKTGDEIFVTVTIMAVTATALAGAYFFNKKRMAQ